MLHVLIDYDAGTWRASSCGGWDGPGGGRRVGTSALAARRHGGTSASPTFCPFCVPQVSGLRPRCPHASACACMHAGSSVDVHNATCDLHFLICLASAMCLLCPYVQPSLTDLLATDKATLAIEQAGRDAGRDLGREGEEEEPLAVMDRPSVHPCVSTSWVLVSYVPIYLMPYYCSRITCPSAVWFP